MGFINCVPQEVGTIERVDNDEESTHYSIDLKGSWSFGLEKRYGVIPAVGDIVELDLTNATIIRGIKINGDQIFYKTDDDLAREHDEWVENFNREEQETFNREKERMDADYEALPKAFQMRIVKFRQNNPKFRVDYEAYELFCCKEAVLIASVCKTPEKVKEFADLSYSDYTKAQELVPVSNDHSGNTFSCACALAHYYLSNESDLVKINGALAPLVGSKEYGDIPNDLSDG